MGDFLLSSNAFLIVTLWRGPNGNFFWTHKPPFIIFLLCLASFGLTLFSLSVFVAQTDKIQNPDVLDWNKLLSKMTRLEYCLPSKDSKYNLTVPSDWTNKPDWTNVTLRVQVSEEFSSAFYSISSEDIESEKKPITARVEVQVKHLGRGIKPEFHDKMLIVSFHLPLPQSPSTDACLEVQGPKELLKYLQLNDTTCSLQNQGKNIFPICTFESVIYITTYEVDLDFNFVYFHSYNFHTSNK